MNENERLFLDALNQYGGPFKKGVINALKKFPDIHILAEEYPAGLGDERTAIDIVASIRNGQCICYFTMECKRALASYKKWVFFKETASQSFKLGRCMVNNMDMAVSAHWQGLPGIDFCSDGCEITAGKPNPNHHDSHKTMYEAKNAKVFKTAPDTIHKAAIQATIGYLSFLQERSPKLFLGKEIPHKQIIVLPLIVTTADIMVSSEDGTGVDMSTGLCELKPPDSKPWVGFRFPCHPVTTDTGADQRVGMAKTSYLSACYGQDDSTGDIYKETIYVVRADQLAQFFKSEALDTILKQFTKLMPEPRSNPPDDK